MDDDDFEYLNKYRWHVTPNGYVRRTQRSKMAKNKSGVLIIYMHRFIMDLIHTPRNVMIDHINHNKTDNRKINLRPCTPSQNLWNSKPRGGASRYKGVCVRRRYKTNKWEVRITVYKEEVYLGQFNDESLAAKAYDEAAIKYFGEFALTNFPKENYN